MDFIRRFIEWITLPDGSHPPSSEDLQSLAENYGIEICWEVEKNKEGISHLPAGLAELPRARELIYSELSIYSPAVIKESRLERIVLCSSLVANNADARGAMVAQEGSLYLDVRLIEMWTRVRRTFHHELFHCIDYRDDLWKYADPDWEKLNEEGFKYSRKKFSGKADLFVHRLGFMTNYSMTAVHEDKAELYAHMIVYYNHVLGRSERDPILKKKVARMQELLKHFSIEFNQSFWDSRSLAAIPLPDDHAAVVKMKIWKERVNGRKIWFMRRLDMSDARTLTFYDYDKLMECFEKFGLNDFNEVDLLYTTKQELELIMRIPEQNLRDSFKTDV